MNVAHNKIDVQITLGEGDFGDAAKSDTITLSGLRVQAQIVKAAMPGSESAHIRIYGLTLSQLNQLTRLGKPIQAVRNNGIRLFASDDTGAMGLVFQGTIYDCYGDFDGMPDVVLNITSMGGLFDLGNPIDPSSFKGGADVAVIMQQIAQKAGKQFKNDGVSVQMKWEYVPGAAFDQMTAIAEHAGINAIVEGDTIVIWPKNKARTGDGPTISKDNGLIGYPKFADFGMMISVRYRPGFIYGGVFTLQTQIENANGKWGIYRLAYNLESEMPGGRWECAVGGVRMAENGGNFLL